MSTTGPLLRVEHLGIDLHRRRRQPHVLVRDVTFDLASGEALGLVGESGSGKSLTSRAVIRLLPRDARTRGTIAFEGEDVQGMGRERLTRYLSREAAMIFQNPRAHINPVRTLGDFLTEPLTYHGGLTRARAEERLVPLLHDMGIADGPRRLRQYPHQLSGGLLQRMMIASALADAPRLLLADEPTTALDVTTQQDVMALLDEQRRDRDLAMLFVTHDLELATAVCDRIAVMYAGTVVEQRPAGDLHSGRRHPYTAGLLAARPGLGEPGARLPVIPGRPAAAHETGQGCPFAARCAFAEDRCRTERPALLPDGNGAVACHRADELDGDLDRPKEAAL
ncbi:ABC transporter ATP-binding protein [Streptomyces sp. SID13726]|uniref:ABC transporter ATP-binding protein n=1 Tax=Streptomyces sp. SID13726 TaxID=2706058 RepID=UPI0013B8A0B5|nr:ABC transporter ATP-binding protein [Streptomyces sp. SID13726]NEB01043.1 ABC transporter ATP-binding protein [Streptomyces sp. SID13726]